VSFAHGGDPFAYQAGRSSWRFGLPEFVGAQLLVITPGVLWAAVRQWRRPADAVERGLGWLAWPHLAAFAAIACFTRVEANWPALALPATVVLLVVAFGKLSFEQAFDRKLFKYGFRFSAGLTVLGAALVPWLSARWPERGPPRDPARLATCVAGLTGAEDHQGLVVVVRYQERALFVVADHTAFYRRAANHRASQYDCWIVLSPPPCDFWYLAAEGALGQCPGAVSPKRVCGRAAVWCACALGGRQG
jgi:hypothetical protein